MKPELAEKFFIEELFKGSMREGKIKEQRAEVLDRLTGDASTRRYYRAETDLDSFVICLDNPVFDETINPFVSKQMFLAEANIRVPAIYDYQPTKGYILEEDLGNETFILALSRCSSATEEFEYYKKSIDMIVGLHKIPEKELKKSQLFNLAFDYNKLIEEIEFTIKHFVVGYLGVSEQETVKKVRDFFSPICHRLSSHKMVLTHRDYHSRNIMIKNNELVMIDFQDARMGIPQYDLASLLDDCYYLIRPDIKAKLMNYYFEQMGEDILAQTRTEFDALYRDMVLQRVFKAIGSFSFIWRTRQDQRYLKYIGFAFEKIRNVMQEDPSYTELRNVLSRAYYEN